MITSTPDKVEQFVGGKKVLTAFGGSVLAAAGVGTAGYFGFHALLGNAWGTTVSQIVTLQVYIVLLITLCVRFRPVTEPPIALRPSGTQHAIASVGILDRNRRCHRIVLLLPRVDLWKRFSGRKADYSLRNRCQTTSGTTDRGLDHCDSAWMFDSSDLRRGVLPRSFALMVAKALECTRRDFRNGRALRLDARIAGRGSLRVHLRGRRWVRPGTHRLDLQHNHYAFAE